MNDARRERALNFCHAFLQRLLTWSSLGHQILDSYLLLFLEALLCSIQYKNHQLLLYLEGIKFRGYLVLRLEKKNFCGFLIPRFGDYKTFHRYLKANFTIYNSFERHLL